MGGAAAKYKEKQEAAAAEEERAQAAWQKKQALEEASRIRSRKKQQESINLVCQQIFYGVPTRVREKTDEDGRRYAWVEIDMQKLAEQERAADSLAQLSPSHSASRGRRDSLGGGGGGRGGKKKKKKKKGRGKGGASLAHEAMGLNSSGRKRPDIRRRSATAEKISLAAYPRGVAVDFAGNVTVASVQAGTGSPLSGAATSPDGRAAYSAELQPAGHRRASPQRDGSLSPKVRRQSITGAELREKYGRDSEWSRSRLDAHGKRSAGDLLAERTDDNVAVPPAPELVERSATASTLECRWWPQTPLESCYELQHQYRHTAPDPPVTISQSTFAHLECGHRPSQALDSADQTSAPLN